MTKATPLRALLIVLVGVPAFGQIGQNHPELCGKANASVLLPPNVSATIDESTGQADLSVGPRKSASKIALPGVVSEIEEVCPVSGNTMVVFSRAAELSEVFIVDSKRAVLLDSIWGFAPALSPDQRWLVFRKFYPRRTELPVSEEYLLYDLAKTPTQNRPPGIGLDDYADVGTVVFPIGQYNTLTDNIGVPEDQQHSAASESFWWAPDGHAVMFGDYIKGTLSVVLVRIEANGRASTSVHAVSAAEACNAGAPSGIQ